MNSPLLLVTISAVWVGSEIALAFILRSEKSDSRDRFSFHVIWMTITLSIVAGSFLRTVRPARMAGGIVTFYAGIALIFVGLAIRWAAILTLRKYFTVNVAIRSDHRVVRHGLYRFVRHPSYLGSLISFVGLGVAFMNWLSLAAILAGTTIGFAYRIAVEERALTGALGDDYREYAAHTKRLIPGVF